MILNSALGVGGAERILVALAVGLRQRGFSPLVCCLHEPGPLGDELRAEGVEVVGPLMSSRRDVRVVTRLAGLLRRRVDVLYLNNQPATQLWGTVAAKVARTPLVVAALHYTARDSARNRRVNRLTGRWIDVWVAISEVQRRRLVAHEGVPRAGRIAVIPNGVDVDGLSAAGSARDATRAALGVPPSHGVVSLVAGMRPEKNHSLFLRAARRILEQRPETTFLLVGDGERRAALEREAVELGVDGATRFLGIRHDVPELVNASDVGVLSSSFGVETSPVTLLEFMACAKPVVSTNVGAVPEIVVDGVTGLLVPERDEHALAVAVLELLADEALAKRLGEAGRAHVSEHFSLDRMLERTEEMLVGAWEQPS
jgi:glycosyltransferase involved in cell wall biosynthesis